MIDRALLFYYTLTPPLPLESEQWLNWYACILQWLTKSKVWIHFSALYKFFQNHIAAHISHLFTKKHKSSQWLLARSSRWESSTVLWWLGEAGTGGGWAMAGPRGLWEFRARFVMWSLVVAASGVARRLNTSSLWKFFSVFLLIQIFTAWDYCFCIYLSCVYEIVSFFFF